MPTTNVKPAKKRPAPFQHGAHSKRPRLNTDSKRIPSGAKTTRAEQGDKTKSRRRPVTIPSEEGSEPGSDDDDEFLDVDEIQDNPNHQVKDLNASREAHKAQRALQEQRKAAKPHSSLLMKAKKLWSSARQKNIPPNERKQHILALMDVIRGNVKDVILKHDASRIVQTVVKYGGQKEREEVATELRGKYRELAQNKYSKFLVAKLLRLCLTHRVTILSEFRSHVIRLLLHREASSVLADAYELYANAYERSILLRDFYGKETVLFTVTTGSDESKERAKKGLKGVLEGLEGEQRKRVLVALKENLATIFNNPDKGAVAFAIVHRALWEYLVAINETPAENEREVLWREIWDSCQESSAEMVHTKDGSRVVREFLARGNAKDRKVIMKNLKPHIKRMSEDEEAQLVLFTALDVIDDTKLTAKSLVAEIILHADILCNSAQGRRTLLYLLVPRTKRHFTPAQIATLAETDSVKTGTSKKDDHLRAEEVKKSASEGLLTFVVEKGGTVAKSPGGSLVVTEIMLYAESADKSAAMAALLKILKAPYPSEDASQPHPIDLPHTARMFKTLLQGGHFSRETNSAVPAPEFSASAFASAFMREVGQETIQKVAMDNGAFVVAELCERIRAEGTEQERTTLKGWFGDDILNEIEQGGAKGKKVLLEKVSLLR